ncbi:heat-inducible transcription repressor HrcA [Amylibacter marinus]|uniref:Heat-inducible transcription repressor HrcA n=1 Tax=Amylibacter marinus TaxID=1475483 RepID=A0ABQ5VVQ6_9RHOB|nr:heat-inducible transcriptional repressor HrcA [Amylibacter marinus]GLQ35517.1 heat-inducible transcription repressor HrcA [Amylibacter marinus]
MNQNPTHSIDDLKGRSKEVFRLLVESYLDTGEPVGSRTLTRNFSEKVSAATIRNVMQDLEFLGLLDSPHTSAGRVPTDLGLRMFVDGVLEVGDLANPERQAIEQSMGHGSNLTSVLDQAGSMLSGLTQGASVVLAPKTEAPIKHIEFVSLAPDRALVVMVTEDGQVENRMFTPPLGQTPSAMREAANFLNSIAGGHTISELKSVVEQQVARNQRDLDILSQKLIQEGVAAWSADQGIAPRLMVRGRSNLIDGDTSEEDMERIKSLFDDLEQKKDIAQFLDLAEQGDGVKIFIGSENKLFSLSGSSLVVSPYMNADRKVIGAVGVIGPTRLNYGRVVPIVDFTAQLIGRILRT